MPITSSALQLDETLADSFVLTLAERRRGGFLSFPAFRYMGAVNGTGSDTKKLMEYGLDGVDLPAADTEIGGLSDTAFSQDDVDATVSAYRIHRSMTDLAVGADAHSVINPTRFAQDFAVGMEQNFVTACLALSPGFSLTVGTTNTAFTLTNLLAAKRALEVANVEGPPVAILHAHQWADIERELLLQSSGSIAWQPATQALIDQFGNSFKGMLMGIAVFSHNRVPLANGSTDRRGLLLGANAIGWTEMLPEQTMPTGQQRAIGPMLFEITRNGYEGVTAVHGTHWFGLTEIFDAAGVSLLSRNAAA